MPGVKKSPRSAFGAEFSGIRIRTNTTKWNANSNDNPVELNSLRATTEHSTLENER